MTETDADFIDRMARKWASLRGKYAEDANRLLALARRGAEAQWRTMETAPRNGTDILLRCGFASRLALVVAHWEPQRNDDPYPWMNDVTSRQIHKDIPTHWQPLTPPGEQA